MSIPLNTPIYIYSARTAPSGSKFVLSGNGGVLDIGYNKQSVKDHPITLVDTTVHPGFYRLNLPGYGCLQSTGTNKTSGDYLTTSACYLANDTSYFVWNADYAYSLKSYVGPGLYLALDYQNGVYFAYSGALDGTNGVWKWTTNIDDPDMNSGGSITYLTPGCSGSIYIYSNKVSSNGGKYVITGNQLTDITSNIQQVIDHPITLVDCFGSYPGYCRINIAGYGCLMSMDGNNTKHGSYVKTGVCAGSDNSSYFYFEKNTGRIKSYITQNGNPLYLAYDSSSIPTLFFTCCPGVNGSGDGYDNGIWHWTTNINDSNMTSPLFANAKSGNITGYFYSNETNGLSDNYVIGYDGSKYFNVLDPNMPNTNSMHFDSCDSTGKMCKLWMDNIGVSNVISPENDNLTSGAKAVAQLGSANDNQYLIYGNDNKFHAKKNTNLCLTRDSNNYLTFNDCASANSWTNTSSKTNNPPNNFYNSTSVVKNVSNAYIYSNQMRTSLNDSYTFTTGSDNDYLLAADPNNANVKKLSQVNCSGSFCQLQVANDGRCVTAGSTHNNGVPDNGTQAHLFGCNSAYNDQYFAYYNNKLISRGDLNLCLKIDKNDSYKIKYTPCSDSDVTLWNQTTSISNNDLNPFYNNAKTTNATNAYIYTTQYKTPNLNDSYTIGKNSSNSLYGIDPNDSNVLVLSQKSCDSNGFCQIQNSDNSCIGATNMTGDSPNGGTQAKLSTCANTGDQFFAFTNNKLINRGNINLCLKLDKNDSYKIKYTACSDSDATSWNQTTSFNDSTLNPFISSVNSSAGGYMYSKNPSDVTSIGNDKLTVKYAGGSFGNLLLGDPNDSNVFKITQENCNLNRCNLIVNGDKTSGCITANTLDANGAPTDGSQAHTFTCTGGKDQLFMYSNNKFYNMANNNLCLTNNNNLLKFGQCASATPWGFTQSVLTDTNVNPYGANPTTNLSSNYIYSTNANNNSSSILLPGDKLTIKYSSGLSAADPNNPNVIAVSQSCDTATGFCKLYISSDNVSGCFSATNMTGNSPNNGTQVKTGLCSNNTDDQYFKYSSTGKIYNRGNPSLCLSFADDNTSLIYRPCSDTNTTIWSTATNVYDSRINPFINSATTNISSPVYFYSQNDTTPLSDKYTIKYNGGVYGTLSAADPNVTDAVTFNQTQCKNGFCQLVINNNTTDGCIAASTSNNGVPVEGTQAHTYICNTGFNDEFFAYKNGLLYNKGNPNLCIGIDLNDANKIKYLKCSNPNITLWKTAAYLTDNNMNPYYNTLNTEKNNVTTNIANSYIYDANSVIQNSPNKYVIAYDSNNMQFSMVNPDNYN